MAMKGHTLNRKRYDKSERCEGVPFVKLLLDVECPLIDDSVSSSLAFLGIIDDFETDIPNRF